MSYLLKINGLQLNHQSIFIQLLHQNPCMIKLSLYFAVIN